MAQNVPCDRHVTILFFVFAYVECSVVIAKLNLIDLMFKHDDQPTTALSHTVTCHRVSVASLHVVIRLLRAQCLDGRSIRHR